MHTIGDKYNEGYIHPMLVNCSILENFGICSDDMAMIYLSPNSYHFSFIKKLDCQWFDYNRHPTARLNLIQEENWLILNSMAKGTPAARIPRLRSQLRKAWLIQINDTHVSTHAGIKEALKSLDAPNAKECKILFSHPEVKHGLANDSIPQINLGKLNNHLLLRPSNKDPLGYMTTLNSGDSQKVSGCYTQYAEDNEGVLKLTTKVMKLTRGKLHRQEDWNEWEQSKFLHFDQWETQFMFGEPAHVDAVENACENSFGLV